MLHKVRFPGTSYSEASLESGTELSRELDITNSPLLFGCRTGICGTCLIEVSPIGAESLPLPSDEERELLDLIAPENPKARLACQIKITADIEVKKIEAE